MSRKGLGRSRCGGGTRVRPRSRQTGPLHEFCWLLGLLAVLGAKLGWDSLAESSFLKLLWFAGEVGYHLAAAEEALNFLLP